MRILFVARRFAPAPGGLENQLVEIACRLTQRGHEISVDCSDLYKDVPLQRLPSRPTERFDNVRIRRHTAIPIPGRRNLGTSLAPGLVLTLATRGHLEVAHLHGLNLLTISALIVLRRRRGCKVLLTPHTDPAILSGRGIAKLLKKCDGLVALTAIEKKQMLRQGIEESKIRVIPNGIDLSSFASLPNRGLWKASLKTTDHLVLYSGRIDMPSKGCDVLVEAVSIAQNQVGACTLVFAGPDWGYQQQLSRLAEERHVKVVFTGNLTPAELRTALASCDVFVLPSRTEAMGIAILEAMACGAPVVASRVGGIPSLVRSGETGLLVPPDNPKALADAICRIIKDRKFASNLAANAKRLVQQYSIDSTVGALEEFYQELLQN